jgi:hypothetical protein
MAYLKSQFGSIFHRHLNIGLTFAAALLFALLYTTAVFASPKLSTHREDIKAGTSFEISLRDAEKEAVWTVGNEDLLHLKKTGFNQYLVLGIQTGETFITVSTDDDLYLCRVVIRRNPDLDHGSNADYKLIVNTVDWSCFEQAGGELQSDNFCVWEGEDRLGDNKASYYMAHNYTCFGKAIASVNAGDLILIHGMEYRAVRTFFIWDNDGAFFSKARRYCTEEYGDRAFFQTCSGFTDPDGDPDRFGLYIVEALPAAEKQAE